MDFIHNQDYAPQLESAVIAELPPKSNPVSSAATEWENTTGGFDCNICFDSAHDPVVTLCGHLYCWACIFKWLHVRTSSSESAQHQTCPVCKTNVSQASLVPLYSRGPTRPEPDLNHDHLIPPRPSACGLHTLVTSGSINPPNPLEPQAQPFRHYSAFSLSNFPGIINPTLGILGELVYTRIFGSSEISLFAYPYPNSYSLIGFNNPRLRRQAVQVDKSLNRVSIFFFCCLILCLLLF